MYRNDCEEMETEEQDLEHVDPIADDFMDMDLLEEGHQESLLGTRVYEVCEYRDVQPMLQKIGKVSSTATKILGCAEDIHGRQCKMEAKIESIEKRFCEEAHYKQTLLRANEVDLRKKYGLYSDANTRQELESKMRRLSVNSKFFQSSHSTSTS